METKKSKLKSIKSGVLNRGFALAKMSLSVGTRAATHAVGSFMASDDERVARFRKMLLDQAQVLSRDLGALKGSVMKVGQMFSVIGENILPPEINQVLKSLQSESPPLEWNEIQKVIRRELGDALMAELEIEPEAIASASMGQVHRAKIRADGRLVAVKIQYPGVDRAIDSDLKALRGVFNVTKVLPLERQMDEIFEEVRQMLHREVDYKLEARMTEKFRSLLAGDARYVVPEVIPRYSTQRILTTSFEEGEKVDSEGVQGLSEERRRRLGENFIELYFRELFDWRLMQTDPHFGNYRIRLGDPDRLVLYDFGAVREIPDHFVVPYRKMIRGYYERNRELALQGARGMGFLFEGDSDEKVRVFEEFCQLIMEPFQHNRYDFGGSDLPKRVIEKAAELKRQFVMRPPPREIVFLDRKLAGVFVFLSSLKIELEGRKILEKYLFHS